MRWIWLLWVGVVMARACTAGSVAAVAVDRSGVRRKMVLRTMQ